MRNASKFVRSQPKRIYSGSVFKSFILMAYKSCFRLLSYLSIGIIVSINRLIGFPPPSFFLPMTYEKEVLFLASFVRSLPLVNLIG